MHSRAVLVLTLALLVGSSAHVAADDDDEAKAPRLSWNPLEKAAAGDWAFYSAHFEWTREKRAEHPRNAHLRVKVEKVVEGDVTLESWLSETHKPQSRVVAQASVPGVKTILDAFLAERPRDKLAFEVKESKDEKKKVGDRELDCTKITGVWKPESGAYKVTLWLSKSVKGLGVVALELDGSNGSSLAKKSSFTLVGYGSGDKADWGEVPAKNAFGADFGGALMAPGSPSWALEGTTPKGDKLVLDPAKSTLVHFYSTWNDCEGEIEWLTAIQKAFGSSGLEILGVASVPKESLGDWDAYLTQHGGIGWQSVADTDGAITKTWSFNRKEVGSHANACGQYLVVKGKLANGIMISGDSLWGTFSIVPELEKTFRGAKVPPELDANAADK